MSDSESLRPLQVAVLDRARLDELWGDLESLASHLVVVLRYAPNTDHACTYERVSMAQAKEALHAHTAHGVQLRYEYAGNCWCDTLLPINDGAKLVRVNDTFGK